MSEIKVSMKDVVVEEIPVAGILTIQNGYDFMEYYAVKPSYHRNWFSDEVVALVFAVVPIDSMKVSEDGKEYFDHVRDLVVGVHANWILEYDSDRATILVEKDED